MHKDYHVEDGAPSLDHRDVEQITLSWHLIREGDPNFIDHMEKVLDKRIAKIMPRVMKSKCIHVSAHSRAVVIQLDRIVHALEELSEYQINLEELFRKAGEQHANLGVQSKHYFLLGEALLSMLEYFLKSSSGYWQRVQLSWNKLFRVMFETMKRASKTEEHRQDQLMRRSRRMDRREQHTTSPQENHSLKTVNISVNEENITEFSSSSHELPVFSWPSEEDRPGLQMDRSSKSMRNLFAASPIVRPKKKDMVLSTECNKPASLRNLFAATSPDKPFRKQTNNHSKSVSMRNILACDTPTSQLKSVERKTKLQGTSMHNLGSNFGSIEDSSEHSLSTPALLSTQPRSSLPSSPRSVASPSGRPGLSRSHSSRRRRDCAVFIMDSPGTPGTRREKKVNSPIESTPRKQLRRKMTKGDMDLIMSR